MCASSCDVIHREKLSRNYAEPAVVMLMIAEGVFCSYTTAGERSSLLENAKKCYCERKRDKKRRLPTLQKSHLTVTGH